MMKKFFLFFILFFACTENFVGQNQCLTNDDAKKIIESLQNPTLVSEDQNLRKEMLAMRGEREKLNAKIYENFDKNQNLIPEANQLGEKHLLRVCQILKENGWLSEKVLRKDGSEAFKFLIRSNKAFKLQRELFPVLVEATKKNLLENFILAQLIDTIRVNSGVPQIFGTEATIKDNIIYLYPLVDEKKVDEWRKSYGLSTLLAQIQDFEFQYAMPVLKLRYKSPVPNRKNLPPKDKTGDVSTLGISSADNNNDENEVLQVDTKLVNLNIRLLVENSKLPANLNLTKEDFTILEDGVEQETAFFSNVEQPFDLILLLDFSGSTVEKRGVIKKAAQRFVEYARPNDRISVVAFTDQTKIISDLTIDKDSLVKKIKDIDLNGGSAIWDSLKFTYQNIIEKESVGRRSAVVFMTDGEDNSRETSFADLLEMVRRGSTTIFSVYIDTNADFSGAARFQRKRKGQQTLQMLADDSGGQLYKADSAKNLNGIYEQIINDLGKVYSIGYEPKNQIRDGGWRNLTVKIKTQPNLIVITRRGYYSN